MKLTLMGAMALLGLALLGAAGAHDTNPNANCNSLTIPDESILAVDVPEGTPVEPGTYYVTIGSPIDLPTGDSLDAPGPQVWMESNDFPGLQTHSHTCRTSPDHVSHTVGADTRIL